MSTLVKRIADVSPFKKKLPVFDAKDVLDHLVKVSDIVDEKFDPSMLSDINFNVDLLYGDLNSFVDLVYNATKELGFDRRLKEHYGYVPFGLSFRKSIKELNASKKDFLPILDNLEIIDKDLFNYSAEADLLVSEYVVGFDWRRSDKYFSSRGAYEYARGNNIPPWLSEAYNHWILTNHLWKGHKDINAVLEGFLPLLKKTHNDSISAHLAHWSGDIFKYKHRLLFFSHNMDHFNSESEKFYFPKLKWGYAIHNQKEWKPIGYKLFRVEDTKEISGVENKLLI